MRGSTLDVRFWRLKTVTALKGLTYNYHIPDSTAKNTRSWKMTKNESV